MNAGRAGTRGIEDFGWGEGVVGFDVEGRLPAEWAGGGLGVVQAVEDSCAGEGGVAFVAGVSEVDDGGGAVSC